jgi:hypothetical protein
MSDVLLAYEPDNLFERQVHLGGLERERIQPGTFLSGLSDLFCLIG